MAESVYKIIELVGTSTESWEKAAAAAVKQASKSLRDLRIAEIVQLDMHMQGGKIAAYRFDCHHDQAMAASATSTTASQPSSFMRFMTR